MRWSVLPAAVDGQRHEALARAAADVLVDRRADHLAAGHARDQHAQVLERPAGRHAVDDVARHDDLLLGVLQVDDRRLARDGDRFRHAADLQVGVDRRGKPGVQLDALAPDDAESLERERHACRCPGRSSVIW